MKTIARMQFGSHVYGTNVPTSDTDFKGVFVPEKRDIILQRAQKHQNEGTKKDSTKKNTSEDIDDDRFSVQEFLTMIARGDTGALDMIFTPEQFMLETSPTWKMIVGNREKFLHKGTSSFAGYCQAQAAKYSLKGSNLAAFRLAADLFKSLPTHMRVVNYVDRVEELVNIAKIEEKYHDKGEPIIKIVQHEEHDKSFAPYLQIGKKTKHALNVSCKIAAEIWQNQVDKYGERAKLAESNEGVDWKALMHAVRVAREAEELLLYKTITFPRPEADLLLKIRKGELDYAEVADIVVEGLDRIVSAKEKTTLPDKPDYQLIDDIVYQVYSNEIFNGGSK